jgi:hypothetical protein
MLKPLFTSLDPFQHGFVPFRSPLRERAVREVLLDAGAVLKLFFPCPAGVQVGQ